MDEAVPENLEARLYRASQDWRLVSAFHHVTWSDCRQHAHLAEARTLLDRFWTDHRKRPASLPEDDLWDLPEAPPQAPIPAPEEAEPSEGRSLTTPRILLTTRRWRHRESLPLGLLVWSLVAASWLPIALGLASLPASAAVKLVLFVLVAYATLPLGTVVLRWLRGTGPIWPRIRSPT